jgi:hypothetical protein
VNNCAAPMKNRREQVFPSGVKKWASKQHLFVLLRQGCLAMVFPVKSRPHNGVSGALGVCGMWQAESMAQSAV